MMTDIEIIRATRRLCLQHEFYSAIDLARRVAHPETRETLVKICQSFCKAQIKVQPQEYRHAS